MRQSCNGGKQPRKVVCPQLYADNSAIIIRVNKMGRGRTQTIANGTRANSGTCT